MGTLTFKKDGVELHITHDADEVIVGDSVPPSDGKSWFAEDRGTYLPTPPAIIVRPAEGKVLPLIHVYQTQGKPEPPASGNFYDNIHNDPLIFASDVFVGGMHDITCFVLLLHGQTEIPNMPPGAYEENAEHVLPSCRGFAVQSQDGSAIEGTIEIVE